MAAALLRRTVATAGLAVLATIASPLVGTALAAGFSGSISSDPAADSNGVVTADRPTFIATYTDNIATTSTITVMQGSTAVACPKVVSGTTVSCTPSGNLVDGDTYTVTSHGVDKADHSVTADAPSTDFTIDIPSVTSASPADQDVAIGTVHPTITFDEAIDTAGASTVDLRDPLNNPVDGSLSFSASGAPNPTAPKDTMTFTPSTSLPEGLYHLTWHAEAPGNSDSYADVIITFQVKNSQPTINPTLTTAGYCAPNKDCTLPSTTVTHYINSLNEKAVPFAGMAQPGFKISVQIYDPTVPNPITGVGPNDRSASVLVPSCGDGVTVCPWQLTVDTTNTPAGRSYSYFVQLKGASGSLSAAPSGSVKNAATDPQLTKDTTAPAGPQDASATEDDATGHVEVTDDDPDSSVAGWFVSITDDEGSVAKQDYVPAGHSTGEQTLDTIVDVGEDTNGAHLVDGGLSVIVDAIDVAGNPSADDAPGGGLLNPSKETVLLGLDIANSFATIGSQQVMLPALNNTTVAAPSSITFQYNEPIKQAWTDTHDPRKTTTINSSAKLLSSIGLPFPGTAKVNPANDRQLIWTPKSVPTDGQYRMMSVRTFSATCSDENAINSNGYDFNSDCEHYYSDQQSPAVDPVVTFNIDDTAPVPAFTSSTSPITSSNFNSAGVSGCVDPDATSVTLILKSSAEPSHRQFVPATITAPGAGTPCPFDASKATWSVFPLPLSGLADGTLTIQAKAVDGASNTTPSPLPSVTAVLKAVGLRATAGDASALLAWSKPAVSSGVSGWTLSITDTTAGTPAVTKSISATASSYKVTKLINGHTYRLDMSDSDGTGPRALATVTPRAATKLTEATSAKTVTYGTAIKLSGRLTRARDGSGLSGQKLTITPRFDNGHFGAAMTVKTTTFGEWSKKLTPAHNATYYVSFAGTKALGPVTAHSARTAVRSRLTWTAPTNPGAVGSPVTLKGKVSPNAAGHKVAIYRHTGSGDHLIGFAKLSSTSTWSFKLTVPAGTTTVVAKIGNTAGNLANRSAYLRLTH